MRFFGHRAAPIPDRAPAPSTADPHTGGAVVVNNGVAAGLDPGEDGDEDYNQITHLVAYLTSVETVTNVETRTVVEEDNDNHNVVHLGKHLTSVDTGSQLSG
jgi:hypothetical protein